MNPAASRHDPEDHSFVGHPRGLAYIAFTEAWERFSYYSMQTLLVLYMVNQLLLPGHIEHIAGFLQFRAVLEHFYGPLSTVALASAIFGLYAGFVYLTPIVGGWIADRWLGRTATVTIGALLMVTGHFLMAFDVSFLVALLCLVLGCGCFKGNLASQVSALYRPEDLRRADAYQIYFLFINAAVIIAPLTAGSLGEKVAWHYGFGAAGVGMLISLVIYWSGRKWLPPEPVRSVVQHNSTPAPKLNNAERVTAILLLGMIPVLAIASIGNMQIFNAYLLWVPDHVSLVFFGQLMPTTWLITVDAIVSVSGLVASMMFWRLYARRFREPSEIVKIAIGSALSVLGVLCLMIAATQSGAGQKASILWVLGFEVLNSLGFANVFPVGLALYARAAPGPVAGTIIGLYYTNLFLCNMLVGRLGGFLEKMTGTQFWLMHAALMGGATVVLFGISRFFGRYLEGAPDGTEADLGPAPVPAA